ncbi:helix-turn-helix domain-containing protein [Acetobacter farinalis]|uniref:helix-turn-helix domain-containing protein n=1 Tax=Acetobacter farinalis TaxID=1260984 RepID=UPI0014094D41|nr:helix-turn-helix domain-containing protein [Acetobacter farinalis]NHO28451.1 helix-turn-helix domain-containing protein [Acetobacter farinalis]
MACKNPTEAPPSLDRAILSLPAGISTGRIVPSADLAPVVEHFWWVRWDTAEELVSEVLPYPSVHIVFEKQDATVTGLVSRKFMRTVQGQGEVFGIKFRPAMFRHFDSAPAHTLTDKTVPLDLSVWDRACIGMLLASASVAEKAAYAEAALRGIAQTVDPQPGFLRDLVEHVRAAPDMRSVSDLMRVSGLSERSLQRLFREYLGVPPKWVIQRFRLQEAAECLAKGGATLAAVAAELGYCDQAHFARDFRRVVGLAPRDFLARRQASGGR